MVIIDYKKYQTTLCITEKALQALQVYKRYYTSDRDKDNSLNPILWKSSTCEQEWSIFITTK